MVEAIAHVWQQAEENKSVGEDCQVVIENKDKGGFGLMWKGRLREDML